MMGYTLGDPMKKNLAYVGVGGGGGRSHKSSTGKNVIFKYLILFH